MVYVWCLLLVGFGLLDFASAYSLVGFDVCLFCVGCVGCCLTVAYSSYGYLSCICV